uniref:Uncharacterized protein n=1 Tax=Arundo donax TaxID=35708 RepID=A0A0A8Y4R2_ARUDO
MVQACYTQPFLFYYIFHPFTACDTVVHN